MKNNSEFYIYFEGRVQINIITRMNETEKPILPIVGI